MAVVGALRVNLGLDSAQFSSGLQKAANDAQRFGQAVQRTQASTRGFGSGMQNVGFQVQDVAVQIAGGTSAFRAFSQQLPQLLSGFGGLGVAIGTVVGVGAALYTVWRGSKEGAQSVDEALKGLTAALSEAKAASDLLALSQGELAVKFGDAALGADLVASQARDKIAGLADAVRSIGSASLAPFFDELAAIDQALADLPPGAAKAGDDIRELAHAFSLPESVAADLVARMRDFASATDSPSLSAALLAIYQRLSEAKQVMGELPPEAEALRSALSGVVGQLSSATAEANALTGAMSAAADEAARLAHLRQLARQEDPRENVARDVARDQASRLAETEDGRTATDRGIFLDYDDRRGLPSDDSRNPNYAPRPVRSGRGGGGAARISEEARQAERDLDALKSKAEQVFNATRTPVEAFNMKMGELNRLVQAGLIDWDTYSRAVKEAQDELARTGEVGSNAFRNMRDDAGDMIASVIQGSQSIGEAFSSMLAQVSADLISSGISDLFKGSGSGGGLFGNILGAIGIPGFANGTNFAPGGLAWVGERGPELMHVPRGARVTPNDELGGFGGGVMNINVNVSGARGNSEIMQMVEAGVAQGLSLADQTLPTRVRNIVADSRRR